MTDKMIHWWQRGALSVTIAFALLFSSATAAAEERWCAVVGSVYITLDTIDCLVSSDDDTEFSILFKNGQTMTGVSSITFELKDVAGVHDVPALGDPVDFLVMHNVIHISKAMDGVSARVYSIDGRMIIDAKVIGDECDIDISRLGSGMYILSVGSRSINFVKR